MTRRPSFCALKFPRPSRTRRDRARKAQLKIDSLEDRTVPVAGQWVGVFAGMTPGTTIEEQTQYGRNLLHSAGLQDDEVLVARALDLSGSFLLQTPTDVEDAEIQQELQTVPGFVFVQDFGEEEDGGGQAEEGEEKLMETNEDLVDLDYYEETYGPFNYDDFLTREKNGEIPPQGGPVDGDPGAADIRTNNNNGSTGAANFTQSETTLVAFGNTVVVGFNDSGSNAGGSNKFTGWAYSTDGGNTFTDGGTLPTNPVGDVGDPVLARDNTTGRIYFATLQFSGSGMDVFHSDDNGVTWSLPAQGAPGKNGFQDKEWIAVDNFAGPGQGNLYLVERDFGSGNGIFFYRSTDQGNTFGPNGGTLIASGNQGAFVAVGTDHSVMVFWYAGTSIMMRKSTDQGLSFGPAITVATGLVGGTNGDLGLTGIRQGTGSASGFRSSEFPHVAVNPVSGNIYAVFANKGAGTDKGDVFVVQSTNGGATWSAPLKVNDDATTTDQWQPTLAVTPDGSRLGIFYYSRQEDLTNNLFKYYGRVATISGSTLTFAPSFAVSDTPSLPEFGRDSIVNSVYMGDYDTAVATPGAFHVTWSDSRFDLAGGAPRKDPDVYYKRIALAGIVVTTTVPAVGSTVSTQPTTFTVNVNVPVDPATLDASDFSVNGIPATAVAYTPGSTTVTFTFASTPVTAQGLQTMHVADGAFTNTSGEPVAAFDGTFRYDVVPLQVVSTNPPFPNGVFTLPGPFTYDVTFNEPVNPASVQATDLVLSGIGGAVVSGVTVLPGNTTARFTIGGLTTTEGALTASIGAGQITDAFGNPGAAFSAVYQVDIGTVPYPTPLGAENPRGSLIYDPTISGTINFAGDTDGFTLNVNPGQTISVLVSANVAGLQPSVTLFDSANVAIASATAAAAGQNALIQTATAATGGVYRAVVSGAGGTVGAYTVQITLNAALEAEGRVPGSTNNTLATAQDLAGSFLTLSTPQASVTRGAAVGQTDNANYSAGAVAFSFEDISTTGTVIAGLTGQDDTTASIPIGFTFPLYGTGNTTVFVSSNGLLTFGGGDATFTNANLTTSPALAAIAPFWDDLHTAGGVAGANVFFQVLGSGANQHLTVQWNKIRFFSGGTAGDTITFEAQLFADGRIQFNYPDLVSGAAGGNNGASATVGIKAAGTQGPDRLLLAFNNGPNAFVGTGLSTLISPPNPTPDYYSFAAQAGERVSVAVTGLAGGTVAVELRNAADAVLASGIGGFTNLGAAVSNFTIPATGTYYVRVAGGSNTNYSVVVTRNAALDAEPNDTFAAAEGVGIQGALGAISAGTAYQTTVLTPTFEDISTTGSVITGLDGQDDNSVSIPIGFTFQLFGTNYSSVFVSSNGLLSFGVADSAFTNADLTTTPNEAAIAPFWDDLFITGGANTHVFSQVVGSGANQHLTVQWNQISFFSGGTTGDTLTFEAQLFADGRVQFNYLDLVSGTAAGNNGGSATVGIKDAGAQGPNRLLLAFNNGPNTFVGTGRSTLVSRPAGDDWYSVNVPSTANRLRLETSTPSDGPGQFGNTLNPQIELYDPSNVLVASGTALPDGRNEFIDVAPLVTGAYRVRILAQGGTVGEYLLTQNSAPVIASLSATSVNENDSATVTGTISDPDPLDTHQVVITWGPGEGSTTLNLAAGVTSFSATHQYLDDNPTGTAADTYPIGATVTDNHGASGAGATSLTVSNVAPSAVTLSSGSIDENGTFTVSGSFTDPGTQDTHTVLIDWGGSEGTTTLSLGAGVLTFTASHQYVDDNPTGTASDAYTVGATVTDDDAGSGSGTGSVTVNNVAPAVTISSAAGTINEDGTFTVSGSFTDPGTLDTHTVVINWGPGETPTTLTLPLGARTFTATHQYRDDNPTGTASDLYPVTVTVTDDDTGSGTAGTSVTVNNLAPSLGVVTAPTTPQAVHTPVTVGATFTDVGTGDTHTATYDWGDGGSTPGTMSEVSGSGSTAATYAYASAGVYTVRITVTDDDTGASSTTSQYVVVYDPTAGFVTGGGWINSPAGAYTPDPALTGKATFGFVSKYKKGQSTPDGNTTFQFHAASMDFKSTSYEWLVISGARAKYKGVGTINGAGNYGFMLTATDGQVNGGGGVDKFRIKIWDKNNGDRVVYDNQMGAADDSYVGTAISGGSIQIQSGPSMTAAGGAKAGPKPAGLTRAALQPIIREAMRRWNLLGLSPAEQQALRLVTFRVADLQGSTLGTTDGHAVTIDRFAAGYGWFVDRTPGSDSEFTTPGNQGEQGKMDLLTVVMHEIGHVLGRPYTPFGVMAEFLATGTRQNP